MNSRPLEGEGKHTAGPWEFPLFALTEEQRAEAERYGIPVNRFAHNDGAVNVMAGDRDSDDRKVVAHVICQADFKRGEGYKTICDERDANARLIAAAPDLLEALQKAAETFREYERLHRAKDTVEGHTKANASERMAVMCEAAISKARGQE